MRTEYQALLYIPGVRRWFRSDAPSPIVTAEDRGRRPGPGGNQSAARSSIVTAEERLRRLGRVCVELGSAPMSLLEVKREDGETFDRQLMDYVDDRLRDGMHPAQVRNNLLVLKSWLGFNGLSFDRKIRLPPIDYGLERIPTKPEPPPIFPHSRP